MVRQHGNEAMEFPVERQAVNDVRAIRLEAAVHVPKPYAGHEATHGVENTGRRSSADRILPRRLPAGDEVEALVELGQKARDLRRLILEIPVDRDDGVAAG